ncbi:hypothetical protein V8F06_014262 [Rhypophila decipiens]
MAEPEERRVPIVITEPVESESVYQLSYLSKFSRNELIIKYLTKSKYNHGLGFTYDEAVDYLRQQLEATCLNLYNTGHIQVSVVGLHLRAWESDMPKALSSEVCVLYNIIVDKELKSSERGKTMSKEYDVFYGRKKQEEGTARALETVKELFSDYQRLPSINGQRDLAGIGRLLTNVWDATSAAKRPTDASIARLFIHIWNSGTTQEIFESHPFAFEDRSGPSPSTKWCEELGYNYHDLLNRPGKYRDTTAINSDPSSLDTPAIGIPADDEPEQ